MADDDCVEILCIHDGRHYDAIEWKVAQNEPPFWMKMAEKYGGPVLELGCGTGRVSIPLAEAGYEVWGLDVSASMLSVAREKSKDRGVGVQWLKGNARDFKLDQKFNLIIFPSNAFHIILNLADIESCLACVKNHLAADGRFIIDLFNPDLGLLTRDPEIRRPIFEYDDPDGSGKILMEEVNRYDRATQLNHLKWFYNIGGKPDARIDEWAHAHLLPPGSRRSPEIQRFRNRREVGRL